METDLARLPFDHYQRYRTAVAVLQRLDEPKLRILEVGANRQRLLSQFFPEAQILYTDIVADGDHGDFVLASAAALPFGDGAFDAVVCLDVLEHMPVELRDSSVREMARVASRLVIIGCPTEEEWVREAEFSANACWADLFGSDYMWLAEHQEFGLVDSSAVERALRGQVQHVLRTSQGEPKLWAGLMAAHFMKERAPSLAPLVASLDHLYNTAVFEWDFPSRGYREFFLGIRRAADAERVSEWLERRSRDAPSVLMFLQEMPELIRPIVEAVVRTEEGWASAVSMYRDQQQDLATTKEEWGKTATALARVREESALLDRDLLVARSGWEEAVAALEASRLRESSLTHDLSVARAGWEEAMAALAKARQREAIVTRDLDISRSGWEEAVAALTHERQLQATLTRDLDIARSGWEEAVSTLNATRAELDRSQENVDHLHADLDVAKREWSATAELVRAVQAETGARIAELEEHLAHALLQGQRAEGAAHVAAVGRTRALFALVSVVIVAIAAIALVALP